MKVNILIRDEGDLSIIEYRGPINEEAEVHLSQLLGKMGKKCLINLRQVEYVNSLGVRGWINFLREAQKNRNLVFEECTAEIVTQMNMIPSFRGQAEIKSVYGSYQCEGCGHSGAVLFEKGRNLPEGNAAITLDPVSCPQCGGEMEMEEPEDEFFQFTQVA